MKEKKFDKEYRSVDGLGFQENESQEMILEGYAVVWDSETLMGTEERGYYEVIQKNAFDGTHWKADKGCRRNYEYTLEGGRLSYGASCSFCSTCAFGK
jgi:hypothetical protein